MKVKKAVGEMTAEISALFLRLIRFLQCVVFVLGIYSIFFKLHISYYIHSYISEVAQVLQYAEGIC